MKYETTIKQLEEYTDEEKRMADDRRGSITRGIELPYNYMETPHTKLEGLLERCPTGISMSQNAYTGRWVVSFQETWSRDSAPWFFYLLPKKYRLYYGEYFYRLKRNTVEVGYTLEKALEAFLKAYAERTKKIN